jgi:hypothetical protein
LAYAEGTGRIQRVGVDRDPPMKERTSSVLLDCSKEEQ